MDATCLDHESFTAERRIGIAEIQIPVALYTADDHTRDERLYSGALESLTKGAIQSWVLKPDARREETDLRRDEVLQRADVGTELRILEKEGDEVAFGLVVTFPV